MSIKGEIWYPANDKVELLYGVCASAGVTLKPPRNGTSKKPAARSKKSAQASVPALPPVPMDFAIAVGDQAGDALDVLRDLSIRRISSNVDELCVGTLILVLPQLGWDSFDYPQAGKKHYRREALVLDAVGRIVVLACPRDLTLPTTVSDRVLGRDGAKAGHHDKVQVINITSLMDIPTQGRESVLRSCEAIGLIVRLAQGMTVEAAISGGRARLIERAAPEGKAK